MKQKQHQKSWFWSFSVCSIVNFALLSPWGPLVVVPTPQGLTFITIPQYQMEVSWKQIYSSDYNEAKLTVMGIMFFVFLPFQARLWQFLGVPQGPPGVHVPYFIRNIQSLSLPTNLLSNTFETKRFPWFFSWIRIRLTKKPHKTKGIFAKNAVLLGIHIYAPGVDIWSIFFDNLWF